MAIKNTGVAARAGQEPAKSAEQVQREYKLQQKFNQISKADNASTTGLLVNPPAAVIPNTTQYYSNNSGSGKEAGAQGLFGAQLGGGAGPNQNILYQTGDQGVTTVINGQKMNPFYGAQAGGGSGSANFGGSIGTVRQGNTHVQNAPVGVYRDQFGNIGNGSTVVPIVYGHPGQPGTPGQQQTADPNFHPSVVKQGMTPSKPAPPANPNFSIGHSNGPQYGGTAGMYTYGQFTNREDAFTALIGKVAQYEQATSTASGMTIPATIADNLGLTASLQDPSSGWKFQNGVWVNTNKPGAPGAGNDYSKLGSTDFTSTQFYQDYAAKNVPFEQQMRYDPASGKYISVGAYMLKKKDKNAYLTRGDRQTKLAQRQKQARKVGYGEQQTSSPADSSYYQPVDQQPTPFTGSWGVVNFNTGTG